MPETFEGISAGTQAEIARVTAAFEAGETVAPPEPEGWNGEDTPESDVEFEDEGSLDDGGAEAEAEAALTGADRVPAAPDPIAARLTHTAQRLGQSPEEIVGLLERFADDPKAFETPAAEPSLEEEVAARLGQDPGYVEGYQLLQTPDQLASRTEEMLLRQNLQLQVQLTRQAVQQERLARRQEEQGRLSAEQRAVEQVTARPEFAPYLKDPKERAGLVAYARQKGIGDMEIAARSYFFDRQLDRGRKTIERSRRSGAVVGTAATERPPRSASVNLDLPPQDVINQGLLATYQWQQRHGATKRRR